MKWIAYVFLFLLPSCITSEDEVHKALINAGYSDIRPGEWKLMGCSDDDKFGRAFIAQDPGGRVVEGTVCCGRFLKGCTLRF